jgi:hypothetical protein
MSSNGLSSSFGAIISVNDVEVMYYVSQQRRGRRFVAFRCLSMPENAGKALSPFSVLDTFY